MKFVQLYSSVRGMHLSTASSISKCTCHNIGLLCISLVTAMNWSLLCSKLGTPTFALQGKTYTIDIIKVHLYYIYKVQPNSLKRLLFCQWGAASCTKAKFWEWVQWTG